jgi:hypothetical protein
MKNPLPRSNQLLVVVVLVSALTISSCVIEKRRYRKGYYIKRIFGNETQAARLDDEQQPEPQTSKPLSSADSSRKAYRAQRANHFIYGATGDGLTKISFNYEKPIYLGRYALLFAQGGYGLTDIATNDFTQKMYYAGGAAIGYYGYQLQGGMGRTFDRTAQDWHNYYFAGLRVTPGKKSLYFKCGWWWTNDKHYKGEGHQFYAGLGFGF